jgi:hypothetical protein
MAVDVARAAVRQVVSYQSLNVDGAGSTEAGVVILIQQHEIYLTFSKTKNGNRHESNIERGCKNGCPYRKLNISKGSKIS